MIQSFGYGNYTAPSVRRFYHEGTKPQRHEEKFLSFPLCLCALVSFVSLVVSSLAMRGYVYSYWL